MGGSEGRHQAIFEIDSSLRQARQRRNLELADVERATCIRIQQLEALEHEQFELLPPDPYRRSFLREYADFLGLNGDLYTSEYDLRFRPAEPQAPPAPPRRATAPAWLLGRRPLLRLSTLMLVVLAGVAAWQLGRPGGRTITPPPASTPARTGTQQRPHARTHPASSTPPTRTLALTAARGSCWLWVRADSSSGPTMYKQTLQPGHTARFNLRSPLWIRMGAPWNLDATIGHHSLSATLPTRTATCSPPPPASRPHPNPPSRTVPPRCGQVDGAFHAGPDERLPRRTRTTDRITSAEEPAVPPTIARHPPNVDGHDHPERRHQREASRGIPDRMRRAEPDPRPTGAYPDPSAATAVTTPVGDEHCGCFATTRAARVVWTCNSYRRFI